MRLFGRRPSPDVVELPTRTPDLPELELDRLPRPAAVEL